MQAGIKQQLLIDALVPDFGLSSKEVVLPLMNKTIPIGVYAREAVLILGFAILMSLLAQIAIRIPYTVVPITGQTFGVLLAGGALGSRKGALSMLVYGAIGVLLLPVFAPSSSAISESLGEGGVFHFILPWSGNEQLDFWNMPSFGYVIGFMVAAYLIGKLSERGWDRKSNLLLGLFLGNVVIYAFGLPWLGLDITNGPNLDGLTLAKTLEWGLWPFIAGDAVKLVAASLALPGAWALVDRMKNRK